MTGAINVNQRKKLQGDRTGVILAAGFGSRLKGTVADIDLKPLTPVAGIPLIFRVIKSLNKGGCSRIIIVLGHGYEEIKQTISSAYNEESELIYVYNERYDLKNGVSLLAAEDYLDGEFVLSMADHIVGDAVMSKVRSHTPGEDGATLLVDYKIGTIFDIDDATKVLARDSRLISIGKQIENYNCIDTGVFVCTPELLKALREVYEEKGDVSLSEGIQALASKGKMEVLDIEDGFWQDVDTPEMMAHAEYVLSERAMAS